MRPIDADTLTAIIDSDLKTVQKTMEDKELEQYLIAFKKLVANLPTIRAKSIPREEK